MAVNLTNNTNNIENMNWEPYDRAAAILCFTLFVVIAGMNGFVIYTLTFREQKKNRLYFFIFHLAIADLLVGVICVLGDGILSALEGAWYAGDIFCRIWRYLKIVVIVASNNLIIGLSIDRFLAVKTPMNFVRLGNILGRSLVIAAWTVSVLLCSFILHYSEGQNGTPEEGGYCDLTIPQKLMKPFLIIMSTATFLVPTIIMVICYTGICILVWRKWKKGLQLSEINNDTSQDRLQNHKNKNTGLLPRAKIKSIKMTLVVCLVFVICWSPYFVFTMLDVYGVKYLDHGTNMVVQLLYPLNSACNPIIFILFNTKLFTARKRYGQSTCTTFDGVHTQVTSD